MGIASPGKWHGGKSYLSKRIVAEFPAHLHYCEPYFGMGSVLLARDPGRDWFIDEAWKAENGDKVPSSLRGCSEVVNDIDGELTNFWRILANPSAFRVLSRFLEATPFSQGQWKRSKHLGTIGIIAPLETKPVAEAIHFFIRCRQSLAGRMDSFAPLSKTRTRRGMNEQASAWLSAVEGLPAVHERLKSVVILNDDALNVIRQQDGERTLFYCDPPYLHETRTAKEVYRHEMSPRAHAILLATLSPRQNLIYAQARADFLSLEGDELPDEYEAACLHDFQGKFLLSGYRSALYDGWCRDCGWHREDFSLPNNAASGKKKRRMTECVWMNFELATEAAEGGE